MPALLYLVQSFDPRGRCNRRALLSVALVMLAVQVLIAAVYMALDTVPGGAMIVILNLVFLWLTTTVIIKRLHDVGRSAWALAGSAIGVMVWSVVLVIGMMLVMPHKEFLPGAMGYSLSLLGTALPVLVGVLWLHCAPGMAGPNRYGPEPDDHGFSSAPSNEAVSETST